MSLSDERLTALRKALLHLPRNLSRLFAYTLRPNPALVRWCDNELAAGMQPIVLCRIERLGDIVATTAIAGHIRRSLGSRARIAWVCASEYVELLQGNSDIDAIFVEPCLTTWMMQRRRLPAQTLVVELFLDSDRCGWTGLRVKQSKSGLTINNYYNNGNSLLAAYSLAAGHPIPDLPPCLPRFAQLRKARSRPTSGLRPIVAVHFASRDPERSWPANTAFSFCEAAIAAGCDLIELGTEYVVASKLPAILVPAPDARISDHLSALANADYFVGVDSGFAHCANALNIPSLILLGNFRNFSGYFPFSGPHARSPMWQVLRSDGPLADLVPEAASAAFLQLLRQAASDIGRQADPQTEADW